MEGSMSKYRFHLQDMEKEMRVVLVGKTGVGKSALGNNLLVSKKFPASAGIASVTSKCASGVRRLEDGTDLVVVDTPGLFNTDRTIQETAREIGRCLVLSAPGPHVFMFVIRVGRFTEEERETLNLLTDIFGPKVLNYVMVVFTERDSLDAEGATFEEYIKEASPSVQKMLDDCGRRCVAVFNKAKDKDKEMESVFRTLRETMNQRRGSYYSSDICVEAEKALEKRIQKLEAERQKDLEMLKRLKADWYRRGLETELEPWQKLENIEDKIRHTSCRDSRNEARKAMEDTDIEFENIETMRKVIGDRCVLM